MPIPAHGPIACTACSDLFHHAHGSVWGGHEEECILKNNPGSWGSGSPSFLLLGFSKGPKQNDAWDRYKNGNLHFEDVPFWSPVRAESRSLSGRERLRLLLKEFQLIDKDRTVDSVFSSAERMFSGGSLVRCSLLVRDGARYTEDLKKIIATAGLGGVTADVISRCTSRFLEAIPSGTLVVLLGLDDSYVRHTRSLFSKTYTNMRDENAISYTDGSRTWVHVHHPSGRRTDKQFVKWLGETNPAANVQLAKQAIGRHFSRLR